MSHTEQTEPLSRLVIDSPIGPLTLTATPHALTGLEIGSASQRGNNESGASAHPVLARAAKQLGEYFAGTRERFDVPCDPTGTTFQRAVWTTLDGIAYGHTQSYGEVAQALGNPRGARAVGGAVGANPIPIIIPCHRVMGRHGAMTGYSGGGGVATKRDLLEREGQRFSTGAEGP